MDESWLLKTVSRKETLMDNRKVYEEIRMLVENHDGNMKFEREGYQWGAWIVKIGDKQKTFHSNGSGFPELDHLYVPKLGVPLPGHYDDYSNILVEGAWDKLLELLDRS